MSSAIEKAGFVAKVLSGLVARVFLVTLSGTLLSWLALLLVSGRVADLARSAGEGGGCGPVHAGAVAVLYLAILYWRPILIVVLLGAGIPLAWLLAGKAWALAITKHRVIGEWCEPFCRWLAERLERKIIEARVLDEKGPARYDRIERELERLMSALDFVPRRLRPLVAQLVPARAAVDSILALARQHGTFDTMVIAGGLNNLMGARFAARQPPSKAPLYIVATLLVAAFLWARF